jgi:hypothetical protein
MTYARRAVALLCLAVLLYAALTPGAPGLLCAVLVPLWLFTALLAVVSIRRETTDSDPRPLPFSPVLAPRAPPVA